MTVGNSIFPSDIAKAVKGFQVLCSFVSFLCETEPYTTISLFLFNKAISFVEGAFSKAILINAQKMT